MRGRRELELNSSTISGSLSSKEVEDAGIRVDDLGFGFWRWERELYSGGRVSGRATLKKMRHEGQIVSSSSSLTNINQGYPSSSFTTAIVGGRRRSTHRRFKGTTNYIVGTVSKKGASCVATWKAEQPIAFSKCGCLFSINVVDCIEDS
ncbi:hypothetical protein ACLOJK_003880 [Asimina triloba]